MKTFFLTLLCLLLGSLHLSAQSEQPQNARPKLGLSLSGGGAKGLAHIGVLKVMEEAGLRPDYITGTSMGSIIGGLYAIGYSADSLERLVVEINWDRVLSDVIDLQEVFLEEKPFFQNELIELPLDNWKIKPPTGAINGQQIEKLLSRLALPAYSVEAFSELPIPFKCMAADVASGEPVVLEEGYLPDAMRTSMAIPTVFTAVRRDGQVLVDGGLIRNFPVEEVVDMGAEVVIGAYTGALQHSEDELKNFADILVQVAFLMSIKDAENQMPLLDLYIEPNLLGFGAQDFKKSKTIIEAGEAAARAQFDKLKTLADSLDALGPPYPFAPLPASSYIQVDRIQAQGNQQISNEEIVGRSGLEPSHSIQVGQIEEGLERLYGTNLFEKVTYRLQQREGETVLTYRVDEKLPDLVKTSLNYDSYHEAGFLFNLTLRNRLFRESRLMLIARVTENFKVRLNYLKYLNSKRNLGLTAEVAFNRDRIPFIQNNLINQEYRVSETPIRSMLFRRFGRNTGLSLGLEYNFLTIDPVAGEQNILFEKLKQQNLSLVGILEHNTLDRNVFPRLGTRLKLEFAQIYNQDSDIQVAFLELPFNDELAFSNYQRGLLEMDVLLPVNRRASLRLKPFVGAIWNLENGFGEVFLIGAPQRTNDRAIPFYGLEANEDVADIALGSSLGYQHFLTDNLLIAADLSAGYFREPQSVNLSGSVERFRLGGGLTLGYRTIVGPIALTVSAPFNETEDIKSGLKGFLSFGYLF